MKKTTKQVPYRCPICNGNGWVTGGFYNSVGETTISSLAAEICRACKGTGIIYTEEVSVEIDATAH